MKTLFLLRHAKAVPGSGGLPDPDRCLSDDGRSQAERVGKCLKAQNIALDFILSSTALRARETTQFVLTAADCVAEVSYDQRIYEATPAQLLKVVSEIADSKSRVLLVGHNPGLEELLRHLTGFFASMGTATLAKIDLAASAWANVAAGNSQLDWLVKPDEMRN